MNLLLKYSNIALLSEASVKSSCDKSLKALWAINSALHGNQLIKFHINESYLI